MRPLPLVMNKTSAFGLHPYALAGCLPLLLLDRAGYALGGGIAIHYKNGLASHWAFNTKNTGVNTIIKMKLHHLFPI